MFWELTVVNVRMNRWYTQIFTENLDFILFACWRNWRVAIILRSTDIASKIHYNQCKNYKATRNVGNFVNVPYVRWI